MSDRNMLGILLFLGGLALIFLPSHETAVRMTAYVQQVFGGIGSLPAALIVVALICLMIVSGVVLLMGGRR